MARQVNVVRNVARAASATTAPAPVVAPVEPAKVLEDLTGTVGPGPDGETLTADQIRKLNSTADKRTVYAREIADKLDGLPDFYTTMDEFCNAPLVIASGPIAMHIYMRDANTLPTDNDKEFGWLSRMYVPGTENTKKEPAKYPDPAWYKVPVKRANGSSGTQSRNIYGDMYDATENGKEKLAMIRDCELAAQTPPAGPLSGKSPKAVATLLTNAEKARASGTTVLERAVLIGFQMQAIRDNLPKVQCSFLVDEEDTTGNETSSTLVTAMKPINVCATNFKQNSNFRNLSVSQFLSLDVAAAKLKGGTLIDLLATMGRETPDDNDVSDEVDLAVMTSDMAKDHVFPQLHKFLGENMRSFKTAFATRKPEDSNAELCTVMEVIDMLDEFRIAYKPRFELIQAKAREADRLKLHAMELAEEHNATVRKQA